MSFVRFLLVGGTAALIQFGVLALLLEWAGLHYQAAAAGGYWASVLFHFTANRYFTFRRSGLPQVGELLRYGALIGLNFIITLFVTVLCVRWLSLSAYVGTAAAILITVGISYVAGKYWVFANGRTESAPNA